ncbi:MAG: TlpA family protein disulfide reductase [Chitinophagaceae bacterium]|nr:TlpA family protein disulfide reductase [Chitinophagaceae bacterium]MBK8788551.1 TlpA family protein disulfide reductase [Chitinophagaceae bacterium]MBL0202022.1 TlpA family protein disulfide reductase [Chitinophagaceae bacterium]
MKNLFLSLMILLCSSVVHAQLRIGELAPEIELMSKEDSMVKLSLFNGKVVLIDFWASWCGPCRAANPYIQKLYKKYKDSGFEVFAVSLDVNKPLWLKAIKRDKLTYMQVIDNSGWLSKVAEKYYIDALPTNFLLDKSGKIVAINIEGKELFDKVKELLQ